ncbi:MAG: SURF1 family protein [Legionella sp.]|nr:SURF1 family protein [Legionella sp.]
MPSLTCFNVRFTPSWLTILISLLCISLFTRLGFWQLHRADEKKAMLKAAKLQSVQQPMQWDGQKSNPIQYQRLGVQGHFLKHVFLLDNQHHQHQFGYDVLSPMVLANHKVILIDRGWVPVDKGQRQIFPKIKTPDGTQQLQGTVYYPNKNQWVLGKVIETKNKDLAILETVDTQLIAQILQKESYPFIMRLDKQDAHGFVRDWAIVSMPFQRHLGYAFQWFAMAFTVLILFIALNVKKKNE